MHEVPIYRPLLKMNRKGFTLGEFCKEAGRHSDAYTEEYCGRYVDVLLENKLLIKKNDDKLYFALSTACRL